MKKNNYLLVGINAKYIHSNPALYSLRRYVKAKRGIEVSIAEYTINNYCEDILKDLYKKKPEVLFFSCYIWNISIIKRLISLLNKVAPELPIWLGGPEVSYNPGDYLGNANVKGVILGEGEETFCEIISSYEEKKSAETVAGIAICRDGQVVYTQERALLSMDDIPFMYEDLTDFENRIIYYESSRGCPFSCSYCLSSVDKKIRFRSLGLVFGELSFFLENNVKQVKFVDRTFNIDPERTLAILEFIRDNDNGITNFHFEIAGDILTKEEIMLLSGLRPGLVQLEIGVQSTNENTLELINRRAEVSRIKDNAVQLILNNNIHVHLDLIAGLPGEDLNSFQNSFNEVYECQSHELQLGFLKVLKGAPINKAVEPFDIVADEEPPYEVLSTGSLSYDDIIQLKNVEEMLEIYHNSMQFVFTEKEMLKLEASPYDFYRNLADFYLEKGYLFVQTSRARKYEVLYEYCENKYPKKAPDILQCLAIDYYLREKPKKRPAFFEEYDKDMLRRIAEKEYDDAFIHYEKFGKGYVKINYRNISKVTKNAEYLVVI